MAQSSERDAPGADAVATFDRTRLAMNRARQRLKEAEELVASGLPAGLDDAWAAAVEWTVWVVALDDHVTTVLGRDRRDALVDEQEKGSALTRVGGRLAGLRYLRNLHAHQLAETLRVLPHDAVLRPSQRLAWAPFDALPLPDRQSKHTDAQQEAYRKHIAGVWVGPIAQRISVAFGASAWRDALTEAEAG